MGPEQVLLSLVVATVLVLGVSAVAHGARQQLDAVLMILTGNVLYLQSFYNLSCTIRRACMLSVAAIHDSCSCLPL